MLSKIDKITLPTTTEEPAEPEVQLAPFEVVNPKPGNGHWDLVTDETLAQEMAEAGIHNLVVAINKLDDEVAAGLRDLSAYVRLISRMPEEDFDLCDALVAKRFTITVNTEVGYHAHIYENPYLAYKFFLIEHYLRNSKKGELPDGITDLYLHISYMPNATEREYIAQAIAKRASLRRGLVTQEINGFIEAREKDEVQYLDDDDDTALPSWMSEEQRTMYFRFHFYCHVDKHHTGIYFMPNPRTALTNFVLNPLFHVYTKNKMDNRRLTEINNGFDKPVVLELPGKAFSSLDLLDDLLSDEGPYFTLDGFTKKHLNKLKAYYLREYPRCFELTTLGWQPEGFFAFSNLIWNKGLVDFNKNGVAEIDGTHFLSMGASNVLEGARGADDVYKRDKFLKYIRTDLTLNEWSRLMVQVYPDHGMMGVTFAIMSAFRDLIFKRDNNFPMLYPYGVSQSGKSKFAESILAPYVHKMPMFNLNQGTDPALFKLIGQFYNVPVGLNEFDENAISDVRFRLFKAAYDGEGRQKFSGYRNKTTEQTVECALILIGQYLSNKDDNSVVNRSLPCKFTENNERTPEQIRLYDELKGYEKEGISSLLCEILECRQMMEDMYVTVYNQAYAALKAYLSKEDDSQTKNRVMINYSAALATIKLLGDKLNLGFTYHEFFTYVTGEIQKISGILNESSALSGFWKTIEFLLDQRMIEADWHFRVETRSKVQIAVDRKHNKEVSFEEPKKLLFLRLNTLHTLYMKEIRTQTGKTGQNEQTILTYMKDQKYYIGNNSSSRFVNRQGETKTTSSYVFDYDLLGVHLETFKEEPQLPVVELTGFVKDDAVNEVVIDTPKIKFTLVQDESFVDQGITISNKILTHCAGPQLEMTERLKRNTRVRIKGELLERTTSTYRHRTLLLTGIHVIEPEELKESKLPNDDLPF